METIRKVIIRHMKEMKPEEEKIGEVLLNIQLNETMQC